MKEPRKRVGLGAQRGRRAAAGRDVLGLLSHEIWKR